MITTLYAGLLAFLYVALTFFVIQGRFKYRVSLGDGGIPAMEKRIRMHGNFAEYAPLGLVLLFLVDYSDFSSTIVHLLGSMLVAGRLSHAAGILCSSKARPLGMVLTMLMIVLSGGFLIFDFFVFRNSGL